MSEDPEKTMKCGLVMPISSIDGIPESHWDEVRSIIRESLFDTPFSVDLVSDSDEAGVIQKRIVQNLYDNEIVICDVSAKNPNVMFELGMRLAFDKPTIIIKDDQTNYSFDTSNIEHLQYPRDLHYPSIKIFKTKLKDKVVATYNASLKPEYTTFLKHFGTFVVAKIEEKQVGAEEYVISAINDLRSEFRNFTRTQQELSPIKSQAINSPPPGNRSNNAQLFALNSYVMRPDGKAFFMKASDPDSPEFSQIFDEYITKHRQKGIHTLEEISSERSALLKAIKQMLPTAG